MRHPVTSFRAVEPAAPLSRLGLGASARLPCLNIWVILHRTTRLEIKYFGVSIDASACEIGAFQNAGRPNGNPRSRGLLPASSAHRAAAARPRLRQTGHG